MIKKAVLPLLIAPFLMVFSSYAFADYFQLSTNSSWSYRSGGGQTYSECAANIAATARSYSANNDTIAAYSVSHSNSALERDPSRYEGYCNGRYAVNPSDFNNAFIEGAYAPSGMVIDDELCDAKHSGSRSVSPSQADSFISGASSSKVDGGACSISYSGGVAFCTATKCVLDMVSESTGEPVGNLTWSDTGKSDLTTTETDGSFLQNENYLNEVPGGCTDSSSCVSIGDKNYLVDWDSAPDYFEYVDSNGITHNKASSGGGDTGGDTGGGGDPTDPTDPTDPGGDNSGGDDSGNDDSDDNNGGGSSGGGGSTVPDFEFDESGIIEAIGSAGRSNRNAINALSNDVTGAISNQTDDLNTATTAQTDTLTSSLDDQTDDLTGAIDSQTGTLTNSLDALGTTFTDALKGLGLGSIGDDTGDGDGEGEGEGEDGEGDGLLGGISKLLNRMVDKIASTFTEDLGDGDDLFDSSGMDDTLDGVSAQEQEHSDEINSLMDEIGEGATSGIADQITSRLPSLPSGGCVPLQFGPMEISCQAFNTIKLWLTWIIYFWTVVSIVDIFFRSEQRTA